MERTTKYTREGLNLYSFDLKLYFIGFRGFKLNIYEGFYGKQIVLNFEVDKAAPKKVKNSRVYVRTGAMERVKI